MDRNAEDMQADKGPSAGSVGGRLDMAAAANLQEERDFFRKLLTALTELLVDQDERLSPSSQNALNAGISILAAREAELIRMEAGDGPGRRDQDSSPSGQIDSVLGLTERRGNGRATLAQVSLLNGVNQHALARLQNKCEFRDLAPDEMLLAIGHSNQSVYFILSGSVRVHLDDFNGPPYVMLGVGECVGEISTLGQTHATAYVIGNEPARLMVISQPLLWDLIDESPEFARNLLYTLSHRLRRDNQFLRRSMRRQRESERHANSDALTGLDNRRGLNERFEAAMQESAAEGRALSLLMIDVDHFKRFNDTHGHLLGDEVLCAIAAVLAECGSDGIAARYGGEEFALVLPRMDMEAARLRGETIRSRVAQILLKSAAGEALPPITVSIGIAQMVQADTPQGLIHAADTALYSAKRLGRNRVVLYDPGASELENMPRQRD